MAHLVLFQLRFVLLVFTILFLQEYLIIQCLLVSASSIALLVFMGFIKPRTDKSLNKRGMFDEYMILLVLDSLLISSDPALNVEARENLGWVLIGLLGTVIIVD